MQFHLRLGRQGLVLAMAVAVILLTPRLSSASVITIDDGAQPGKTEIPFTCVTGPEGNLWLPSMGFVYRNVEAFDLQPGDTIAFDIAMAAGDPASLAFRPQLDIALAHAPDPLLPFKPVDLPGPTDFTVVAHAATASSAGNRIAVDYDLVYTVDAPFSFPGGGLIIRVNNPLGPLATSDVCKFAITADIQPNGTNRLVGTFKLELLGEYPWLMGENTLGAPAVPYVRITWTHCGDGVVSGTEPCDDGNTNNADACSNLCQVNNCGDGVVTGGESCDDANTDDTD
jgi:cysteine-rich repeat protein